MTWWNFPVSRVSHLVRRLSDRSLRVMSACGNITTQSKLLEPGDRPHCGRCESMTTAKKTYRDVEIAP